MEKINVTKTFLPDISEYFSLLEKAWKNVWITNRGPLVQELEAKLLDYTSASNIILTTNGTLPLQIALKVLGNGGEVITTPFSYIATTSSILWEHCTPVFVDIDPFFLTIDETKIEEAITENTTAILATHVFGNPCHVEAIATIAAKHGLKVIYDAAHAFDVTYKGNCLFNYGDVSTCSFHATKVFHTGEGGALFTQESGLLHELFYSHNFGHNGPHDFHGIGINAKMSELQAAMGLAVLPHIPAIIEGRKSVVSYYDAHLDFSKIRKMVLREGTKWNYSYYPVIFEDEATLLHVQATLNQLQIFPRRYFYPSLNTLDFVTYKPMPVSEKISSCILCLPLYDSLSGEEMSLIVKEFNKAAY